MLYQFDSHLPLCKCDIWSRCCEDNVKKIIQFNNKTNMILRFLFAYMESMLCWLFTCYTLLCKLCVLQ